MKKFSDAIPTATPTVLSTEFTKLENFLTTTEEKFDELVEVTEEIEGLSSEIESLTTSITEANAISERTAAELGTVKITIKEARASLKELPAITRQVEKLEELLELADESEATTAISKATKLRDKQKEKFDKLTANLKNEQDKRTRQLAGELAAELNTGDECPVCGSFEHPKKAQKSSGSVDMESLSDKRDNQFELLKDAEQDLKEAQGALKSAQTAKAKLPTQAEQKALLKKYNSLQKLTEEEDLLANKLLSLETTATSAAEQVNQEKQTLTAASTSIKTLKGRQTALKKQTEPIGSAQQLSDAVTILDDIRDALDELSNSVGALNDKQSQMKQADTAVKALLKKSTFSDEKTVKSALLNEDVLEEQLSIVHSAEQREITIGNLIAAIGEKPLPKKRPEVEALAEKVEATKAELEDAQHIHGIVKGALTDITKAFKEVTKIGPTYAEKKRQAQSVASIATVFKDGTGKNAGGQLDLETWVLRTLFEEVCLVANDQMRQLSSNRYALTLDQEEGGVAKRRGGGLDIYVLDAQTGLTRPVQTMSGGEQFIASLALALALAEVVQRHAGGIEVPCLFIDEGFGGLDLETLDIAIDVLLKIQATGRSVGIITHVETMQQLLPIGIRVHKGNSGSTLEVLAS
jgi:exonuclease SbcC